MVGGLIKRGNKRFVFVGVEVLVVLVVVGCEEEDDVCGNGDDGCCGDGGCSNLSGL